MTARKRRDGGVSLPRVLSKLGYTSRSMAVELIRQGHVSINGIVIRNPSARCSPGGDRIAVDGKELGQKRCIYVLLNKPEGVLTTRNDERGRPTVYDLLGEQRRWLFPVGRLDKDTSGMLLLTNDNRLGEILTNPRSKVPKTYRARLDRPVADRDLEALRKGVILDGQRLLPPVVSRKPGNSLQITIVEGKNRQIRRMCEHLGYTVVSLMRTMIGKCDLRGLKQGEWRYLTKREVKSLCPRPSATR